MGAQIDKRSLRDQVEGLTVRQRIGQLFTTFFFGAQAGTADPSARSNNIRAFGVPTAEELVTKYHLGGVVLYAWAGNVQAPQQIATLCNDLQRAATTGSGIPLLIGTDHETGVVTRIPPPATELPGSMAVAATGDPTAAETAGRVVGTELRAMGINQVLAPVCDVNVNIDNPVIGVRSFGDQPDKVARFARAAVSGLQEHVSATAKHFPGHGDTTTDSHTGRPVIHHTREQWECLDLPPFVACLRAGVDSVMTGHVVMPALDPTGAPATVSAPILRGVLRQELGFDGLILSDALDMYGSLDEVDGSIAVRAIEAGVDVIVKPAGLSAVIDEVHDAVMTGRLTEERINESVLRVLRVKRRRGLSGYRPVDVAAAETIVGQANHVAMARDIAERSITLIRDDVAALPLPARHGFSVAVVSADAELADELARCLAAEGRTAVAVSAGDIDTLHERTAPHAMTVAIVCRSIRSRHTPDYRQRQEDNERIVGALTRSRVPMVLIGAREPADFARFSDVPTVIATWSPTRPSLAAVAGVLAGRIPARGILPMSLRSPHAAA